MTRTQSSQNIHRAAIQRVLIVGNYCHDVLIQNGAVIAESVGGAASFISNVLNGLCVSCKLTAKVGFDFRYVVNYAPIVVPSSQTTVFEAYFDLSDDGTEKPDRVLRRVSACDPIRPADLPDDRFDFGLAVGVGGEILPETLEKMVDICRVVSVDIQALIRVFDSEDGTVKLVNLKDSGFYHLLPRIGFLKASSEEALFVEVDEVKRWCCVVVTRGKQGCKIFHNDDEIQVSPFVANQVDPTGAGDSFLGGFVGGLVEGLPVADAALLGNLFGSLTVAQIGLPKFDSRMLQRVKDEVRRRKKQYLPEGSEARDPNQGVGLPFAKLTGHDQFHDSLGAAKLVSSTCPVDEC